MQQVMTRLKTGWNRVWTWYQRQTRRMQVIIAIVLAIVVLGAIGVIFAPNSNANTPTSNSPTWQTVKTFSGQDTGKTADFTVNGSWRAVWTCTRQAPQGAKDGMCQMRVDDAAGTWEDVVANTVGSDHGTYHSTRTGQFHFQVSVYQESWKIEIQQQR